MSFLKKIAEKSKIISALLLLITFLHQFFGESKWQYYPLYFLAFLYFTFISLYALNWIKITPWFSRIAIALSVFLILLTLISLRIFRKTEMLEPTGDFAIGTQTFDLEDRDRQEPYTENEKDYRRIKYQVWYPSDQVEDLKKVNWLSDGNLIPRQLLKSTTFPSPPFLLDQLAEIESNSYADAAVKENKEKYPVIIISHGWRGFRELHTDFAEDLASQGYFVLSIDHTYGSEAVHFKDGKIAYLKKEALPKLSTPSVFSEKAHKLAVTYGKDVKMVLDNLKELNERFGDQLNLEKVGLLGHSTGGAGDAYAALHDERVKAVIGMDAWVNPLEAKMLERGLEMPSLFLRSKQWAWRESREPLNTMVKNSEDAQIIEMDKTKHLDFPMVYMFSPYTKHVGLTGKKGGRESSILQREIVRDFFDDKLKNKEFSEDYLKKYVEQNKHLHFEREDEWFEELSEKINKTMNT
ncbi:MAG: alpha/beta fold hydrolase, partial [Atopostipes sp.]|nr:alpha/beta fold hydrolase [Atopostipes sp.]